jgi:acid phosphatase family membrane protein YuiD
MGFGAAAVMFAVFSIELEGGWETAMYVLAAISATISIADTR